MTVNHAWVNFNRCPTDSGTVPERIGNLLLFTIMAKGIEMNGMLRGKRGGNVYYRKNGEQVSRARNTEPANPRSNKQLYQRAVMATCMRMYSLGKIIFDHSFQGRKKGSENQSRFMALNAKIIRNGIAAQINSNTDNKIRVVGPGVVAGVVNPIQVSEGTYQNRLMSNDGRLLIQATAGETVADYCKRAGLISGDIYTWIVLNCSSVDTAYEAPGAGNDNKGKQFVTAFNYAQVKVKSNILSNTTAITADTQYAEIFEAGNYNTSDIQLDAKLIGAAGLFIGDGLDYGLANACTGIIRSREDSDLRSTTVLTPTDLNEGDYGLSAAYLLNAWSAGTMAVGTSELILEGSDF